MSGLPTLHVKLDDGTGTYPTDITTRANLTSGVGVSSFGRTDEFSQPQSAQLTLTLDNQDGHVTDGTITIQPGTGIRVTETVGATTSNRFTGRISSLQLGWPGGGEEFATVLVSASDAFADLARRPMRSMLEEEILLDGPTLLYTLGEEEGATTAGDTSGNQGAPLHIAGSGAAMAFGNADGPHDGLSAASFAGGKYLLRQDSSGTIVDGTGAWTVEVFFTSPGGFSTAPIVTLMHDSQSWTGDLNSLIAADITSTGHAELQVNNFAGSGVIGSAVLTDSDLHCVAITYDGTTTLSLFVDGAADGTTAIVSEPSLTLRRLEIGGTGFIGALSMVSIWNGVAVSGTRLAEHAAVGLSAATEATDDRLTRLTGYVGITPTTSSPSGQLMSIQQTSGQFLYDALQDVATAEGGILYVDGSGTLTMQGRNYRTLKLTADATLGEQEPDPGTSVTWDTQQKINLVTVTRSDGATQTVKAAAVIASINEPIYSSDLQVAVDTDDAALDAGNWLLAKHTETAPRLASITFDLMTSPNAATLLSLEIGDRISLTAMPTQLWADAGDYTIEGWDENLGTDAWTVTFNLLPWSIFEAFILNDAAEGLLNTGVLGY